MIQAHETRPRRDRTGTGLRCGRRNEAGRYACGGKLPVMMAAFSEIGDDGVAIECAQLHIRDGVTEGPGGILGLSKYAAERVARGKAPKFRRQPKGDVADRMARGEREQWSPLPDLVGDEDFVRVRRTRCGTAQRIDNSVRDMLLRLDDGA